MHLQKRSNLLFGNVFFSFVYLKLEEQITSVFLKFLNMFCYRLETVLTSIALYLFFAHVIFSMPVKTLYYGMRIGFYETDYMGSLLIQIMPALFL